MFSLALEKQGENQALAESPYTGTHLLHQWLEKLDDGSCLDPPGIINGHVSKPEMGTIRGPKWGV